MRAYIEQLVNDYAFVQTPERRVFMHRNDCDFELRDCQVGDIVDVDVEDTKRGPRVVWARWIERPEPVVVEGVVQNVVTHRGIAFMIPDGHTPSQRVLLNVRAFVDHDGASDGSAMFAALQRGDRVRCIKRSSDKGDRGFQIERV